MAVPKKKVSKAKGNSRFSANQHLETPGLVECSHCHEMKLNHTVCKKCGYYDGEDILGLEAKKKEKKKEA